MLGATFRVVGAAAPSRSGRRGPPHVATVAATSGASTSQSSGAGQQLDGQYFARRLQAASELLQEAAELAVATGPRGLARTAQAATAVLSVTREQLQRLQSGRAPDSPAATLRTLFERLGGEGPRS